MALKWFTYFCSEVEFVLKVDDDSFINTSNLFKLTETITNSSKDSKPSNLIFCRISEVVEPCRDPDSKWYLSKQEYPEEKIPEYCMGFFVLYSSDVVIKLYNVSQQLPYLWIEDVQITGIARSKANLTLSTNTSLIVMPQETEQIINGTRIDNDFVVASQDMKVTDIKKLWAIVENNTNSS
jgi:hypothetical protein